MRIVMNTNFLSSIQLNVSTVWAKVPVYSCTPTQVPAKNDSLRIHSGIVIHCLPHCSVVSYSLKENNVFKFKIYGLESEIFGQTFRHFGLDLGRLKELMMERHSAYTW